jgi:hypothetical protein
MPNAFFLTHRFTANSALARDLIRQGSEAIQSEMRTIGPTVESEVKALIQKDFAPRSGFLHKEGDPHLADIQVRVEVTAHGGTFPIDVVVDIADDSPKIGALEFGSKPHPIPGNPLLYFPSSRIGRGTAFGVGAGSTRGKAFGKGGKGVFGPGTIKGGTGSRGGKSKQLNKLSSVDHPGNRPHHFVQKGLDRAVAKIFARGR